jgi:hypothetical protein
MTQPADDSGVKVQLAVISTKLDVLIEQRTDHETRVRALERFKWVLLGVAAAAGPAWDSITAQIR